MLLGELLRASINMREAFWVPGVARDFWRREPGSEGEPAQNRCSHERWGNRLSDWEWKVAWARGAAGAVRVPAGGLRVFSSEILGS